MSSTSSAAAVWQLLLVAISLCVVVRVRGDDFSFLQDVSHRSVYSSLAGIAGTSTAWPLLPFDEGTSLALVNEGRCVLAVSSLDGKLYGAARKSPVPDKITLDSPFSSWRELQGEALPAGGAVQLVPTWDATSSILYIATEDNIVAITFNFQDNVDACGSVLESKKIVPLSYVWGSSIVGLVVASSSSSSSSSKMLFLGSSSNGVFSVSLSDGSVAPLMPDVIGTSCSCLYWVEAWSALFTANTLALYTVRFVDDGSFTVLGVEHEWIGGVIDTVPLQMDFDEKHKQLYLVESAAVHRLSSRGEWYRFGYQQGAPMANLSSVAVVDDVVFIGSKTFGVARFNSNTSPHQLDGQTTPLLVDDKEDPWAWQYYYDQRYLPGSNAIVSLQPVAQGGVQGDHSVFVVTTNGLALLQLTPWTLAEKATAMQTFQTPRHDRHGLTAAVNLRSFGDLSTYQKTVDDNDGLWTSMHAMGCAYRYAATKEQDAFDDAWYAFEGLERLSLLSGGYPNFVARSFCKVSDNDAGCMTNEQDPLFHNSSVPGWIFKADTSSDELSGHLAAYPLIYDFVAQNAEQKARVLALIEGITRGIIKNDYYLIDPTTNQPTSWGYWSPTALNDDVEHYSERGCNSLEILAWLTSAYSITGNDEYKDAFWSLVLEHGYVKNALNAKIDSTVDENHSDTELLYLAYHSLFYALQRLPADAEAMSEADKLRRQNVQAMVEPLIPSLRRTFTLSSGELSSLWTSIYAGTAGLKGEEGADLNRIIKGSVWSLRRWAIDNINWQYDGTQRMDLIVQPFTVRQGQTPLMKNIRPPSERVASHANTDPFEMWNGSGGQEFEPAVWALPYYIALYNNLI